MASIVAGMIRNASIFTSIFWIISIVTLLGFFIYVLAGPFYAFPQFKSNWSEDIVFLAVMMFFGISDLFCFKSALGSLKKSCPEQIFFSARWGQFIHLLWLDRVKNLNLLSLENVEDAICHVKIELLKADTEPLLKDPSIYLLVGMIMTLGWKLLDMAHFGNKEFKIIVIFLSGLLLQCIILHLDRKIEKIRMHGFYQSLLRIQYQFKKINCSNALLEEYCV
ncbi:MAG TPA: hypothetical protein VLJ15_07360 [Gammaproteobacteria bacterium]|nr:hypothetical protein [Gammaproteobacteria bacterium]